MKTRSGFTLVELIVVIGIIGVLAAILIPAMIGYIKDAKLGSANSSAKVVYTAVNNYAQKCAVKGYPMKAGTYSAIVLDAPAYQQPISPNAPFDDQTTVENIELAICNTLNVDGDQSVATVVIGDLGFPEAAAWAMGIDDIYVGAYPKPSEEETDGGIANYVFS